MDGLPRNYKDGKLELLSLDAGCEDMEGQSSLGFDEPGTPHPARRLASAMVTPVEQRESIGRVLRLVKSEPLPGGGAPGGAPTPPSGAPREEGAA